MLHTRQYCRDTFLAIDKNVANGRIHSPQLWRTKKYYWTSLNYINRYKVVLQTEFSPSVLRHLFTNTSNSVLFSQWRILQHLNHSWTSIWSDGDKSGDVGKLPLLLTRPDTRTVWIFSKQCSKTNLSFRWYISMYINNNVDKKPVIFY